MKIYSIAEVEKIISGVNEVKLPPLYLHIKESFTPWMHNGHQEYKLIISTLQDIDGDETADTLSVFHSITNLDTYIPEIMRRFAIPKERVIIGFGF